MKSRLISILFCLFFTLTTLNAGQDIVFQKIHASIDVRNTTYVPDEPIFKKHWDKFDKITRIIYLKGFYSGWDRAETISEQVVSDIGKKYQEKLKKTKEEEGFGDTLYKGIYSKYRYLEQNSLVCQYDLDKLISWVDKIYSQKKYEDLPLEYIVYELIKSKDENMLYHNLDICSAAFHEPPEEPY